MEFYVVTEYVQAEKKARFERTKQAASEYQKVVEEFRKKKAATLKETQQLKKDLAHQRHEKKTETVVGTSQRKQRVCFLEKNDINICISNLIEAVFSQYVF